MTFISFNLLHLDGEIPPRWDGNNWGTVYKEVYKSLRNLTPSILGRYIIEEMKYNKYLKCIANRFLAYRKIRDVSSIK